MSDKNRKGTGRTGMKRRAFLQYSGAMVLAGATLSDRQEKSGTAMSSTLQTDFELEEVSITGLQAGMQSGRYTARSIAALYIKRIGEIDKQGPAVNAVMEINPDALSIADALDEERRRGRVRGPLHGIPVMLKDNIDTADRMHTTAGSLALMNSVPGQDAFLVRKLREAGAVILGKTNLSEWANFRSNRSSSGWSGRGGQTRNPYALDRNPCGSSSGSGVAVASNLCAIAVGTETNGSIMCPSTVNSIVGIKPTLGLISRSGIIPIAHSQDTAGPMARTVADAVAMLGVMTGEDPSDGATLTGQGKTHQDYTPFLDAHGLQGARIGVARNYCGFHEKVDALMEEAIDAMKREGAMVMDPANIPTKNAIRSLDVLLYEFKADLNAYLSGRGGAVRSLKDLIAFNDQNKETEMPYFGQELFLMAEEKGPLTSPEYLKALETARRVSRDEGIDAVLGEHRLDAIIAPTGGPPWVTDLINGDRFLGGSSAPAAVAGYPNITVPAGYMHGLPVGISFFAGAYSEPALIKIAFAYEQATKHRRPPRFLATAELG